MSSPAGQKKPGVELVQGMHAVMAEWSWSYSPARHDTLGLAPPAQKPFGAQSRQGVLAERSWSYSPAAQGRGGNAAPLQKVPG